MTDAADLELLRRHEPILRYTRGESFLPMDVRAYVANASLDVRLADGSVTEVVPAGELTIDRLGSPPSGVIPGRQFLRVARERSAVELAPDLLRGQALQASGFRRGAGRLTRVGYVSRLVDALFSLTLLLRGRVPGALARDSIARYRSIVGDQRQHPYYGRVVREAGWIVLQYWFFYAYNDWRSGFHGANDHEADWEMMMVVLDGEAEGTPPCWAVYAQHDFDGADLRRRWDHAEQLEVVDGHPVVYAGAGSHASYFVAGEYLTEHELAIPGPLRGLLALGSKLFSGQGSSRRERVLPIAFVDYARGDGEAIGHGAARSWTPVLVEHEPWARGYRGLWGAHVRDPFEGEDAPAGPMYARDGSPRSSWVDPLGFGALDVVPPPSTEPSVLRRRAAEIEARQPARAEEIAALTEEVAVAGTEQRAIGALAGGRSTDDGIEGARARLSTLRSEQAADELRLAAIGARLDALARGEQEPPGAHLRHFPVPTSPAARRFGGVLEVWAAVSIGLLLLGLIYVLVVEPELGVIAAVMIIGVFLFVESVLRGTFAVVVSATTLTLAVVAVAVLALTFWTQGLVAVAVVAGLFVIWQNLGELR